MKKLYQAPDMELTVVCMDDILTESIEQFFAGQDPYAQDKATW